MIQPSPSTATHSRMSGEPVREDGEASEGLGPIVLSSQARERLRVFNQVLESAPPSINSANRPTENSQPVLTTINE